MQKYRNKDLVTGTELYYYKLYSMVIADLKHVPHCFKSILGNFINYCIFSASSLYDNTCSK